MKRKRKPKRKKKSERTRKPRRTRKPDIRTETVWLAVMMLGIALVCFLLIPRSCIMAILGILGGGVALMIWQGIKKGVYGGVAGFLAILAGVIMLFVHEPIRASLGKEARDVLVAEVPTMSNITLFYFADARIAQEYTGYSISRSKQKDTPERKTVYQAAPLVPTDWTPDEPVPAWVVGGKYAWSDWNKPYMSANRVWPGCNQYIEAIKSAEADYGLTSHPNAPMLRWSRDARAKQRIWLILGGSAIAGLFVIWGIAVYIIRRYL